MSLWTAGGEASGPSDGAAEWPYPLSPVAVTMPHPCGRQMSTQTDVTLPRLRRVPGAAETRGSVGESPRCYGVTGTSRL